MTQERAVRKQPLYRKVNTTAHAVPHRHGGDFRDQRAVLSDTDMAAQRGRMARGVQRGLDYTPLFRFLLARVGQPWAEVYAEACARLDKPQPIFWLVALRAEDEQPYVRIGAASYYSGLKVDAQGLLQRVDPQLGPHSLPPTCRCCTHTFNGERFTQTYVP